MNSVIPTMTFRIGLGLACLLLLSTVSASAQEPARAPLLSNVLKSIVRDPVTYGPAITKLEAMHLDWESSQIFFQHGYVEHNPRYTVSGRTNDVALSHGAGSRKLVGDSLKVLAQSVPANLAERMLEQLLIRKYPSHTKMWLIAGHASRIAGSSYLSYSSSFVHLQQWRRNERLARQMGYK